MIFQYWKKKKQIDETIEQLRFIFKISWFRNHDETYNRFGEDASDLIDLMTEDPEKYFDLAKRFIEKYNAWQEKLIQERCKKIIERMNRDD